MRDKPNPRALSDDDLLRSLSEMLAESRRSEADLVAHIGEVDARKLYRREATPSMFVYCTERLHLSEHEAYLRIVAARASRKHPALLRMLRDGRLHLSGIARLAPHLTPDNRDERLKQATHKSKRQIEQMIAALAPRPEAPTIVRRVRQPGAPTATAQEGALGPERGQVSSSTCGPTSPAPSPEAPGSGGALTRGRAGTNTSSPSGVAGGPARVGGDSSDSVPLVQLAPELGPDRVPAPPPSCPSVVEPRAADRFRIHFDASAQLCEKLERLQALMRSSQADVDLAMVVEEAVTEKLERLEAKRFGKTRKPRQSLEEADTTPKSRHIPAAVRRAVHERDGGRCTYRNNHGRRCSRRHDLEFHHEGKPYGRDGDHSPENIRLMCRTHNLLRAEEEYGEGVMARFRRSASREPEPTAVYAVTRPVGGTGSVATPEPNA